MELKHFENLGAVLSYVLDELTQSLQDDLRETQEQDDDPAREAELQAIIDDIKAASPLLQDAVDSHPPTARALSLLLTDVENGTDFGMPFEREDHPFHESVTAARAALGAT